MTRLFNRSQKWIDGVIVRRLGPVSYLVQLNDGSIWKRHINHIRARSDQSVEEQKEREQEDSPESEKAHDPTPIPEIALSEPYNLPLALSETATTTDLAEEKSDVKSSLNTEHDCSEFSPKQYPKRNQKPPNRYM